MPYPPGGGADTTARIVYQKLGEMWGKQFVIDNRGGAGGTIAEAVAAKADPDGYTILHDATAFSVNPALYPKLVVRLRQGLPAGDPDFAGAQPPGGDAVGRGQDRGRHRRACQEDAGRPRFRVVGQRHAAASVPGASEVHGQGADQPHSLSRRRRRAEGRRCRQREIFLLQRLVLDRAGAGRAGEGAGAHRQGPARHAAGPAGGAGHHPGLRRLRVERTVRSHGAPRRTSSRSSTPASTRCCDSPTFRRASSSSISNTGTTRRTNSAASSRPKPTNGARSCARPGSSSAVDAWPGPCRRSPGAWNERNDGSSIGGRRHDADAGPRRRAQFRRLPGTTARRPADRPSWCCTTCSG